MDDIQLEIEPLWAGLDDFLLSQSGVETRILDEIELLGRRFANQLVCSRRQKGRPLAEVIRFASMNPAGLSRSFFFSNSHVQKPRTIMA